MFAWKGKKVTMKPSPLIPKPIKEKEPKLISICHQDEFCVELKETKKSFALVVKEEVVPSTEISEKIKLEHVGSLTILVT